jgi:hypothetical protein
MFRGQGLRTRCSFRGLLWPQADIVTGKLYVGFVPKSDVGPFTTVRTKEFELARARSEDGPTPIRVDASEPSALSRPNEKPYEEATVRRTINYLWTPGARSVYLYSACT